MLGGDAESQIKIAALKIGQSPEDRPKGLKEMVEGVECKVQSVKCKV